MRGESNLTEINLLPDEKIVQKSSPKVLSFLHAYLPYIYLSALGIAFLAYQQSIESIAEYFWILGPLVKPYLTLVILLALLVIPAIIFGLLQISMKLVLVFAGISAMGIVMQFQGIPSIYRTYMLIGAGILSILLVEAHRRSHKYYVTNYRLILERTFPRYDRREIMLEKIQDIAVQQGLLGRIFNFGNVIPTSGAGVGTGEDTAGLHLSLGTKTPKAPLFIGLTSSGTKGVTGFRSRPHNCLFGVPNPKKLSSAIIEVKFERSEATKLEEIKRILEKNKGGV